MKKRTLFLLLLIAVLFGSYFMRFEILRGIGHWLIREDELTESDAIAVLGGNSKDRSKKAAQLYEKGISDNVICLGANIPFTLKSINKPIKESELTKRFLRNRGVKENDIILLQKGKSTQEEGKAIIDYCRKENWDTVTVVSSKFHLRRINWSYRNRFEKNDICLRLSGAPSSVYSEEKWWESEEGMLMVNNEYMKLLYYVVKY